MFTSDRINDMIIIDQTVREDMHNRGVYLHEYIMSIFDYSRSNTTAPTLASRCEQAARTWVTEGEFNYMLYNDDLIEYARRFAHQDNCEDELEAIDVISGALASWLYLEVSHVGEDFYTTPLKEWFA